MSNPEIMQWLAEQKQFRAKELLGQTNSSKSEGYLLLKSKLHCQILAQTGAVTFSQYWNILTQAVEAGWPVASKVMEEKGHLEANEFSVKAALDWLNEKGIKLKPVPAIDHNPVWYLKEK